ncbi:serine/threonine-protein kinase [Pseudooceanicola sp. C21-150M6]|uniref:serine/threonine-protein kinase n=1 Tax=Pseudooceanicola sp. C21-150M6 TaxID=3434355 RepID=UPI003D7FD007
MSGGHFNPGDLLNNTYRIDKLLGRGGVSEVYLATSDISGRQVAVKVLKPEFAANADYLVLMTREEDVREIRDPAVVRYFDNQRTADGLVYLVMDFIDGPGLDARLKDGAMPAEEVLVLARRVLQGLRAAHDHRIVHRDLSPDNIILRGSDPAEAVIIDFGIAKDTKPEAETIVGGEFAGKYAYAAPEQLDGQADARSDIYALGMVLLAAARGKAPDFGTSPGEVVRRKAAPVDTAGLPEPLKTLIDRMTTPDPEDRLQSAEAVLALLDGEAPQEHPELADATIIAPPPARTVTEPPAPTPPAASRADAAPATPDKPARRSMIPLVLGLVALLAIAGAGAWFGGLLGPSLPFADRYVLHATKTADGGPTADGVLPDEDALSALVGMLDRAGGDSTVTLARGDIPDNWGALSVDAVGAALELDSFTLSIAPEGVEIEGRAPDAATRDRVTAALTALPATITRNDIQVGPLMLPAARLEPVLQAHADCGPLSLLDPPAAGYGPQDPITVTGRLATVGSRIDLFDALGTVAGQRPVDLSVDMLNPVLCTIEAALPQADSGGFGVQFGFGNRPDKNPDGRYFTGENPVIDVIVPDDVTDGFLWVSIVDVTGNVFHLLPNINRPDNSIASLREEAGVSGPMPVRVAYSLEEADGARRLGFTVDDSTLGKSKVVVIHSDGPIFPELRPTTESVEGYAAELEARAGLAEAGIRSLDSATLVTAKP